MKRAHLLSVVWVCLFSPFVRADVIDKLDEIRNAVAEGLRTAPADLHDSIDVSADGIVIDDSGNLSWAVTAKKNLSEGARSRIDGRLRELLTNSVDDVLERDDLAEFGEMVENAKLTIPSTPPGPGPTPPGPTPPGPTPPGPTPLIIAGPCLTLPPNHCHSRSVRRGCCAPNSTIPCDQVIVMETLHASIFPSSRDLTAIPNQPASETAAISPLAIADAVKKQHMRQIRLDAPEQQVAFTSVKEPGDELGENRELGLRFYALGYHSYWQKDYEKALGQLRSAAGVYSQDARIWFYCGLCQLALRQDTANESFARAIILESQGKPNRSLVGRSLERIQGRTRYQLEIAKQQALVSLRSLAKDPKQKSPLLTSYDANGHGQN